MKLLVLVLAFVSAQLRAGSLWMPAIFGDHMVLPSGDRAVLWGEDAAGQTVTAFAPGITATATADAEGKWQLRLKGLKGLLGGPFELTVQGSETRVLHDVLAGEVWLNAGQSNMEFDVHRSANAEAALKDAEQPMIRLFTVERAISFTAAKDVKGEWKKADAVSVASFSAVAWFNGLALQKALGVPVGLVAASWGGTPAETWTPRAAMAGLTGTAELVAAWDADPAHTEVWKDGAPFELQIRGVQLEPPTKDEGRPISFKHALDLAQWTHSEKAGSSGTLELTGTAKKDLAIRYAGRLQGGAYGGASFPLNPKGPMDLRIYKAVSFEVRGNGTFTPAFTQDSIKDYDYYIGDPIKLTGQWQRVSIDLSTLKQGGWGAAAPLTLDQIQRLQFAPQVAFWPDAAEIAYNGMIKPLQPFAFQGLLWYQGESNAGRAKDYAALLTAMLGAWRQGFGVPLPAAIIQLPEWKGGGGSWRYLREAQRQAVLALQPAVLVPAFGLGDPDNIHPTKKAELGARAAAAILRQVYQRGIPASPLPGKALREKSGSVAFLPEPAEAELSPCGGTAEFQLAGADGVWVPAKASVDPKGRLHLGAEGMIAPMRLRYGWDEMATPSYGWKDQPLAPFDIAVDDKR
jgi:sialate O-acetylesterase